MPGKIYKLVQKCNLNELVAEQTPTDGVPVNKFCHKVNVNGNTNQQIGIVIENSEFDSDFLPPGEVKDKFGDEVILSFGFYYEEEL